MPTTAKLFTTGRSQAVRLPMWESFFELADCTPIPDDFMADRQDLPAEERTLL